MTTSTNVSKPVFFPEYYKKIKVIFIFIFNSGREDLTGNYRPISILSPIAEIFKELLYVRIEKYFSFFEIISSPKFWFRKGCSTEMAIIHLQSTLQTNLDEKYFTCCIFSGLSKAFDTVYYKILINNMNSYGILGNMQSLLSNYFTNRNQCTE